MSKMNNFVINIATVNGSGSQSANNVLLKSLFRMGIPVGGKNVFPSNIAGLPTWFWIRANQKGFLGRKKFADIVVTLNPQTYKEDIKTLAPGGFFIHAAELVLSDSEKRNDVTIVPVPFKKLVDQATDAIKIKKLLTNMIYVGVLSELLKLDMEIVKKCIQDLLGKKASVLESNMKAFDLGAEFAKTELQSLKIPFQVQKQAPPTNKIIIDGNSAGALGLINGGCTFASWYPITPSSSLMESFIKFSEKLRVDQNGKRKFAVVQAEDELAAFSMVLGAGWAGARAITATSGPGLSLMAEGAGYAYFAEIPSVIWDVQRAGPSTGLPTRTLQSDLLFASQLSHGDKRHPILIPGTPEECYEFGQTCFDLAERLQQLIIVLSDLDLGMNLWITDEFQVGTKSYDRGKVLSSEQLEKLGGFERYRDVDGDGIPYRTLPGNSHMKAAYFTRGSGHNAKAQYTENSLDYKENHLRLEKKWQTAKSLMPTPILKDQGQKIGLIFYGSTQIVMDEVIFELSQKNILVDTLRIRALPFHDKIGEFINSHEKVYVIEQNRDAQMRSLLRMDFPENAMKLKSILHFDGTPITSDEIVEQFLSLERGH
jgi:2-oxoglutarate ferredoxin oxidoreductase subunit alpha